MGNTSNPKFKAGERVAYVSGDAAILGRVDDILLLGDVWHYRIIWEDFLPDREMRPEPNFRERSYRNEWCLPASVRVR